FLHELAGYVMQRLIEVRAAERNAGDLGALAEIVGLPSAAVVWEVARELGVDRPAELVALRDDFLAATGRVGRPPAYSAAPDADKKAVAEPDAAEAARIVANVRAAWSSRGVDPERYIESSLRLGFPVYELAVLEQSPIFRRLIGDFFDESPEVRAHDRAAMFAGRLVEN